MSPGVIRKIHEATKNNSKVVMWGDGKRRREFMFAEDIADFIYFAINNYEDLENHKY